MENVEFQIHKRTTLIEIFETSPLFKKFLIALQLKNSLRFASSLVKASSELSLESVLQLWSENPSILLRKFKGEWMIREPPNKELILDIALEECIRIEHGPVMSGEDVFIKFVNGKDRWHFGRMNDLPSGQLFCVTNKLVQGRSNKSNKFVPLNVDESNILAVRKDEAYIFEDRVYHREVYRLQLSQVDGRLKNLPVPSLPTNPDFICNPSTFRLYVTPLNENFASYEDKEIALQNAGQLQHALYVKDNPNSQSSSKEPGSSVVRCNVNFKCSRCFRQFKSNNVNLELINGVYLDPYTVQPPYKNCKKCHGHCSPDYRKEYVEGEYAIEPFQCGKHVAFREHSPDLCVKCQISKTWCDESIAKFKLKPSTFDANIIELKRAGVLEGDIHWIDHAYGLEISDITYKSERFRVLITPSIFAFPTKLAELAELNCREANLLMCNSPPVFLNSFREVLVALNFQMQASVRGLRGPWTNKVIEIFIANETKVDAELIDGFKRFSLPMMMGDDPTIYDSWLTAYHGTGKESAALIFLQGGLSGPKDSNCVNMRGQCGSTTGNSIYTSPSKELAGFPTYSKFFDLKPENVSKEIDKFGQIVFEVKVRPGYRVQNSTLKSRRYWPANLRIDPRFESHDGLEWLHESRDDVVLTAILVRQFGKKSEEFGELNCLVERDFKITDPYSGITQEGPEFHWTALRRSSYQEKGDSHKVVVVAAAAHSKHNSCCAYIRKEGDSRVLASVMWKKPSEPRSADTSIEEEATENLKLFAPELHRDYCKKFPLTPIVIASKKGKSVVDQYTAAVLDVYLCVESKLVGAIQRDGFIARVRPNIAVESSIEAARRGYNNHHRHEPCATFKILPSPQLHTFRNVRGSLRVSSNYIPPHGLEFVSIP